MFPRPCPSPEPPFLQLSPDSAFMKVMDVETGISGAAKRAGSTERALQDSTVNR